MFPGGKPNEFYRTAFKLGMSPGPDITALQIGFNDVGYTLTTDGSLGPKTDAAINDWQLKHTFLAHDGVAGLLTQQSIFVKASAQAEKDFKLPVGTLKGVGEGESSYALAAVSPAYLDDRGQEESRDFGSFQDNVATKDQTDAHLMRSFSTKAISGDTAKKFRTQKDIYKGQAGAKTDQEAWWCAILFQNWQAAADQYAAGTINTWTYYERVDGVQIPRKMDDKAMWVEKYSGGRLHTGREWATDYVAKKIIYVRVWPA